MKSYYSYGSVAHDYDNYNFDIREEIKPVEIEKPKTKSVSISAFCILLFVVFSGSLVSLYSLSLVNSKASSIVCLQDKLESVKSDNVVLEEEISKKFDLSSTQKVAEKRLGMHRPFAYQIVHIKKPKQNYVVKHIR